MSRVVRGLSLGIAALLAAYAISDDITYGGQPGFGATQAAILGFGLLLALSTLLPLKWNRTILLTYVSALLTLLFAELAGEVLLAARHRGVFEMHPRYLFQLRPDCYQEFRQMEVNGGRRILSHINRDRFRGEELQPSGQSTRVVVYGDSFIHAAYAQLSDTFVERLEDALESKLGRTVEAVNAGVSSYGPDQVSLKLEDEIGPLAPDLVVVAIFAGNDFGDLLRNKLFGVDGDGRLRARSPTLSEDIRFRFRLSREESIIKRALADMFKSAPPPRRAGSSSNPRVAELDFALEKAQAEYEEYNANDEVTNPYKDYYNADSSLTPNAESARYKRRLMKAVMARIKGVADKASVPLVFVFIPHPLDVCEDYDWGFVQRDRFPDYRRENLTDALAEIAGQLDVPYVNLFDTFREHVDANRLYFHGGDDHWNPDGQKLAAEVTATFIQSSGLLGR